jgi:hypothetical protein
MLTGLAARTMTRETAQEARSIIMAIDKLLVQHLTIEDEWLYPTLMASADPAVRAHATDCFEEMGGICGAWIAYRDLWDVEGILAHPVRFRGATDGVIGAVAIRVDRENTELYPAMDRQITQGIMNDRAA